MNYSVVASKRAPLEPDNLHDGYVVANIKDYQIVGHISQNCQMPNPCGGYKYCHQGDLFVDATTGSALLLYVSQLTLYNC